MKEIENQVKAVANELIIAAHLEKGDILVVGCSSSEIAGQRLGTHSSLEAANAVYSGLMPVLNAKGIFLAVQCCEHLNRAVVIEKEALKYKDYNQVNAVPIPTAGGAFATVCYNNFSEPVLLESIKAKAGIDIGDVLIGMQIKEVAVPVRLSINRIGEAHLVCARSRAKFVGGERAVYNEKLL